MKRDTVFHSLVDRTDFNGETILLLQSLCKDCVEVMERQLKTELPGGEYWNPSAQLLMEAETCSNTNISGERCNAMQLFISALGMASDLHCNPGYIPTIFKGADCFKGADWARGKESNEERDQHVKQDPRIWPSYSNEHTERKEGRNRGKFGASIFVKKIKSLIVHVT